MAYKSLLDNVIHDWLIHNGSPVPATMYYQGSTCTSMLAQILRHIIYYDTSRPGPHVMDICRKRAGGGGGGNQGLLETPD